MHNKFLLAIESTKRSAFLFFLLLLAMGVSVENANAQDVLRWNKTDGGVYSFFGHWTPSGVPGPLDTAEFNLDATYTVSLIQNQVADILSLVDGDVTLKASGIGAGDRTISVNDAQIGDFGISNLTLESASSDHQLNFVINESLRVDSYLQIRDGSHVESTTAQIEGGEIRVLGTNDIGIPSTLDVADLTVGLEGYTVLSITDGAAVTTQSAQLGVGPTTPSGTGIVNVEGVAADGTPSSFTTNGAFQVGIGNRGFLGVRDGGYASTPGFVRLGGLTTLGIANVDGVSSGNASQWITESPIFRYSRTTVSHGGVFTSQNAFVGRDTDFQSIVTIGGETETEERSIWATTETLTIGSNANAHFSVDGGGQLFSGTTIIGEQSEVSADLSVSNTFSETPSAWHNSGDVFVGGGTSSEGGSGVVELGINSQSDVNGTLKIWGTGQVLIDQGAFRADVIENTNGGEFEFVSGTLEVNRFEGDLHNQGGLLGPGGAAAGSTVVVGNFQQQSEGLLAIDIGGSVAGVSHDLINVSGLAILDGELSISVIGGFTPDASGEYTILVAGTVLDSFDNVVNGQRLNTTNGSGSFIVNYGVGSPNGEDRVVLSDFESNGLLLGDVNGDGVLSLLDVAPFVDAVTGGNHIPAADINQDGVVSLLDVAPFVQLLVGS